MIASIKINFNHILIINEQVVNKVCFILNYIFKISLFAVAYFKEKIYFV